MGADIKEWFKGITFFVFITIMFYFLWTNIFSNIITFAGSDLFNTGETASLQILKGIAWSTFVLLYLSIGAGYLIFSIVAGSRGEIKTKPLEFLKAVSIWCIVTIVISFSFGLTTVLMNSLPTITGEATSLGTLTCTAIANGEANSPNSASCTMSDGTAGTWSNADIITGMSGYVWIIYVLALIGMACVPFYYVLRGYNVDILGGEK